MNLGEFCVLFSFHLLYSLIFCCCNLQSFHQRRMPSTTISKSTLCCLLTLTALLFVVVARVLCFVYIAGEIASSRRLCFPSNFLLLLSVYKKKKFYSFENVYINWYWMIANVRCLCSRPAWCLWVEGGKVRLRLLHHQCWLILCEWFEVLYWIFVDAALVFCHLTNFSYILKAYG